MTDQVSITLSLDRHDTSRLQSALRAEALPAELKDDDLIFKDVTFGFSVEKWYSRLMRLNRSIHAQAKRSGTPIKPYKTLDRVNLLLAIIAACMDGSTARMAHEVIWRQPFPNANHRTAVAAIGESLGLELKAPSLPGLVDTHFAKSKLLLDGSDKSLTNQAAKLQHQQVIQEMVEALQSLK